MLRHVISSFQWNLDCVLYLKSTQKRNIVKGKKILKGNNNAKYAFFNLCASIVFDEYRAEERRKKRCEVKKDKVLIK